MSEVITMKRKPRLRLVEQPVDINAKLRADIASRDWTRVHVRGDRSAPVYLPERRLRTWRA